MFWAADWLRRPESGIRYFVSNPRSVARIGPARSAIISPHNPTCLSTHSQTVRVSRGYLNACRPRDRSGLPWLCFGRPMERDCTGSLLWSCPSTVTPLFGYCCGAALMLLRYCLGAASLLLAARHGFEP